MITVNVVLFIAAMLTVLIAGAVFHHHVYGVNRDINERIARFQRDNAICDEAENGWPR